MATITSEAQSEKLNDLYQTLTERLRIHLQPDPSLGLPDDIVSLLEDIKERHVELEVQNEMLLNRKNVLERALRENELHYKVLLESVTDYVYSVKLNQGQPMTTVHGPGCVSVTGYTSEDYKADPNLWYRMVHPDDRADVTDQAARMLSKQSAESIEHRLVHKDGTIRWVRNTPVPRFGEQGVLVAYDGLITDVTERKQVEQALRVSESKFRTLAEFANAAIFIYSNNQIRYVNPAAEILTGYRQAELLAMDIWNIIHTEFRDSMKAQAEARLEDEPLEPRVELLILTKTDEPRWVDAMLASIEFEGETAILGTAFDITERKRIEQALQESEERYRRLVSLSFDAIAVQRQGMFISVNPSGARLFGAAGPEDLIGRSIIDFVHPDYVETVRDRIRQTQDEGQDAPLIEEKLIRLDGSSIDAEVAGVPVLYQGQPAVQVVIRDISRRKSAEAERERLLEAEREQRLLAETLGEVFLALTAQISYEAVLDEILHQAQRVVSYNAANIVLLDNDILRIVHSHGYETFGTTELVATLEQSLADFPLDAEVIQSARPLIIFDTHDNPDWVATEEARWIRSFVAVPIQLHERMLGLLRLDSDTPHSFSRVDVSRLQPLANAAAIALENAQLYDQIHQRLKEQMALQEAGMAISSTLNLSDVLSQIAKQLTLAVDATSTYICSYEPENMTSKILTAYFGVRASDVERSIDLSEIHALPRKFSENFGFLLSGLPELIHADDPAMSEPQIEHLERIGAKTILNIPLLVGGKIVAFAELWESQSFRHYSDQDVALCQGIAQQAAIALENARLFDQVQRELAERNEAQRALRQLASRDQAILDAIPDTMFLLSLSGKLLDYKLFGADFLPGEAGQAVSDEGLGGILPGKLVDRIQNHIDQTASSGQVQVFEYHDMLPFGPQYLEVRMAVSRSQEILVMIRNVTERKQAERQAIRTERMAALGRLAATLAHEINNPLQSIQAHLDLILDFPLEEGESDQYLQIVRHEIKRLTDIAQNVLNFAHPKPALRRSVAVQDLLQQVLTLMDKQIQHSGSGVIIDLKEVAPVIAAPDQLTQVFLNLIMNGIEAVSDHKGKLHVAVYPEADQVVISFTSPGARIPPEILPHIFEPFFTTKPDGSGLGLWISHSLIAQHAGTLTAENLANDQGVVFTVKLPSIS